LHAPAIQMLFHGYLIPSLVEIYALILGKASWDYFFQGLRLRLF